MTEEAARDVFDTAVEIGFDASLEAKGDEWEVCFRFPSGGFKASQLKDISGLAERTESSVHSVYDLTLK